MDCRNFHRNLEDYLEGGLDFPGRFGMERHAQQCISCGKTVADAQKLSQMARQLGRVGAPADFEASLLKRIQSEGVRRTAWRSWRPAVGLFEFPVRRFAVAGGLTLLLAGVGFFFVARWTGADGSSSAPITASATHAPPVPAPIEAHAPAAVGAQAEKHTPALPDGLIPGQVGADSAHRGYAMDYPPTVYL